MFRSAHHALTFAYSICEYPIGGLGMLAKIAESSPPEKPPANEKEEAEVLRRALAIAHAGMIRSTSIGRMTAHDMHAQGALIRAMIERELPPVLAGSIRASYGHGDERREGVLSVASHLGRSTPITHALLLHFYMRGRRGCPSFRRMEAEFGGSKSGYLREYRGIERQLTTWLDSAFVHAEAAMLAAGIVECSP